MILSGSGKLLSGTCYNANKIEVASLWLLKELYDILLATKMFQITREGWWYM